MNSPVSVAFATKLLKAKFVCLEKGKSEDVKRHKDILKAIEKLKSDKDSGIKIPRRLWPKFYVEKYLLDNLWKLDLSEGWRLTYTIKCYEEQITCMILEWMTHKEYERRFGY